MRKAVLGDILHLDNNFLWNSWYPERDSLANLNLANLNLANLNAERIHDFWEGFEHVEKRAPKSSGRNWRFYNENLVADMGLGDHH